MQRQFTSRLMQQSIVRQYALEVELPEDSRLSLQIFDDSGRECAVILTGQEYTAGSHRIEFKIPMVWQVESVSGPNGGEINHGPVTGSGPPAYFYRLSVKGRTQSFVDTKRIAPL